jgi:glycosyltransferase involved in cell wall biosynthesis
MRILIVNDGFRDAGGVQSYLSAVMSGLRQRGHELRILHRDPIVPDANVLGTIPQISASEDNLTTALAAVRAWRPDVAFSHNMSRLQVDRELVEMLPVVKFMHGYFGTCISGMKMHAFPKPCACDRTYSAACVALFLPRRCGRFSPIALVSQWRWAETQRSLFDKYAAVVVASDHMRQEYARNGIDPRRTAVNPLFPTELPTRVYRQPATDHPHVAFIGRMTPLKGGDLLIRATRRASDRLGTPIRLTMMGDGPQRGEWEALARQLSVPSLFTGWVEGPARWPLLSDVSLLALPSVWPEPFGLVGLEAGAVGVPAIAVSIGGIGEWLRDGVNGVAVAGPPSAESFGDALAEALKDPDALATLRAGARRMADRMSLAGHLDRLETVFDGVVGAAIAS